MATTYSFINESPIVNDIATALELIASESSANIHDYYTIRKIVRDGKADKYFDIGDKISMKWNDGNNHEYDMSWDVVDIANVVNEDGDTVPGLWLQSHWALPGVQFDASEAIYYCESALPAGTYYFTIGTNWGTHCVADSSYSFTTTQPVPVGGQIVVGRNNEFYTWGAPDYDPSTWRVHTFDSASSITPIETNLTLTAGTGGTSLGTVASNIAYGTSGPNNLQRSAYGYNRWSQSGIRQWLNSDANAGAWWKGKNVYDRPPQQLSSMRGFMAGLPTDFLDVVAPVQVVTALNTVSDSAFGNTETTVDKFFLPSLEQEYIEPQLANVEGAYWPYWKQRMNLNLPQGWYNDNANTFHIRYAIENHASTQSVRLRSARRGYAYSTWGVHAAGYVSSYLATTSLRMAPACVIC